MKRKKRYIFTIALLILLIIAFLTNPQKYEYIQFTEEAMGEPPNDSEFEVEHINFYIFFYTLQ